MAQKILEVKNLKTSFRTPNGTLQAVRDVSFDLMKGETLAVVGESGSGKSVTSRAVMGLLAANAVKEGGQILFDGRDLMRISEEEFQTIRGEKIAMVLQDPFSSLDPIMRIGKQLTEAMLMKGGVHRMENGQAADGKKERLSRDAAEKKALQLLESVGIDDPARRFHQYPFELSGGMRQRVVIAMALAADPDILICDEPTTALDVTIQAQILDLLNDLKKKRDLSVLFITHDLGVVAKMADRVAVMYAGKICEIGTAEEIFYEPAHPYTWALLSSVPDPDSKKKLEPIPGMPPDMTHPPKGDAFAERNPYAQPKDFEEQPPMFRLTDTHYAATWLLEPGAPKAEMPAFLKERLAERRKEAAGI